MMRSYENVLRDMHNDVKANVQEANERRRGWENKIAEIKSQLATYSQDMAGVKKLFSIWQVLKAKRRSGITAEEARAAAEMYEEYASIVDRIGNEQQALEAAEMSLCKVEKYIVRSENVQLKIEDLMVATEGLIESDEQ